MSTASIDKTKDEAVYPYSDGEPMGETYWHVVATLELFGGLTNYFRARPDVFVAANMFLYYIEGKPKFNKCPDIMVVFGVPNHPRPVFKTWEEGAVPSVVIEVTSPSTFRQDCQQKLEFYRDLGVSEYYLFDPLDETWDSPLLAYRLDEHGDYQTLPFGPDGGADSAALGLRLVPEGPQLRLYDLAAGRPILTGLEAVHQTEEAVRRAEEAVHQAEQERQRADALEVEVRRLREQLAAKEADAKADDHPAND